jgi:glutamate-1-semialdehyde 2,1-aminomutase
MAALAPAGASFTGGTFSGNPFCVAMGHRMLDALEARPNLYADLDAAAGRLADGLRGVFARLSLPYAVTQLASMVDFKFRPGPPVRNYDEAKQSDAVAFAAYYHGMRSRGVLLAPSPNELMFLSTEHGSRELERTLEAAELTLRDLREQRLV